MFVYDKLESGILIVYKRAFVRDSGILYCDIINFILIDAFDIIQNITFKKKVRHCEFWRPSRDKWQWRKRRYFPIEI